MQDDESDEDDNGDDETNDEDNEDEESSEDNERPSCSTNQVICLYNFLFNISKSIIVFKLKLNNHVLIILFFLISGKFHSCCRFDRQQRNRGLSSVSIFCTNINC